MYVKDKSKGMIHRTLLNAVICDWLNSYYYWDFDFNIKNFVASQSGRKNIKILFPWLIDVHVFSLNYFEFLLREKEYFEISLKVALNLSRIMSNKIKLSLLMPNKIFTQRIRLEAFQMT